MTQERAQRTFETFRDWLTRNPPAVNMVTNAGEPTATITADDLRRVRDQIADRGGGPIAQAARDAELIRQLDQMRGRHAPIEQELEAMTNLYFREYGVRLPPLHMPDALLRTAEGQLRDVDREQDVLRRIVELARRNPGLRRGRDDWWHWGNDPDIRAGFLGVDPAREPAPPQPATVRALWEG